MDGGAQKAPIHGAAEESDTTERLNNNNHNNLTPDDLSASSQAPTLDQKSGKPNAVVHLHWASQFTRPALSPEMLTGCKCRPHISLCALCCAVTQRHLTLCDLAHCSPPASSVHEILQARILGCHFHLQRIFLTQGLNPYLLCLLHHRQILYH